MAIRDCLKKLTALLLAGAILALSPGLPCYQVLGANFEEDAQGSPRINSEDLAPLGTGADGVIGNDLGGSGVINLESWQEIPQGAAVKAPTAIELTESQVVRPHPTPLPQAGEGALEPPSAAQQKFKTTKSFLRRVARGLKAVWNSRASAADLKKDAANFEMGDLQAPSGPPVVPGSSDGGPPSGLSPPGRHNSQHPPGLRISEDFLGFRTVRGVARAAPESSPPQSNSWRIVEIIRDYKAAKAVRLAHNAGVSEIIDHLSIYINKSRDEVLRRAAALAGLTESSSRELWLAAYDEVVKSNAEGYDAANHHKYEHTLFAEVLGNVKAAFEGKPQKFTASFRTLENKTYAPGWAGVRQRVLGEHWYLFPAFWARLAFGFCVRFVNHLFLPFFYGLFQKKIGFQFFHAHEDFLNLTPGGGEKALEHAFLKVKADLQSNGRLNVLARAESFSARISRRINSTALGRALVYWLWSPLGNPLLSFIRRRLFMAFLSCLLLGLLGAGTPIPFIAHVMNFNLMHTLLGPAVLGLNNGLLSALAATPVLGHFLLPAVTEATNSLIAQLTGASLLRTYLLSLALTLSNQSPRDWPKILRSKDFWKEVMKSFASMLTVNAEISGVLGYFTSWDALVDGHVWYPLIGSHFKGTIFEHFNAIHYWGSTVEGKGGTIGWGNSMMGWLQAHLHFNIANAVMHFLDNILYGHNVGHSAQSVVQVVSQDPGDTDSHGSSIYKFDPNLYLLKDPTQAQKHFEQVLKNTGDFEHEVKAVKEYTAGLQNAITKVDGELDDLQRRSIPITNEEGLEYKGLIKELQKSRAEESFKDKLAEKYDLKNSDNPGDVRKARLDELNALRHSIGADNLPKATDKIDWAHATGTDEAYFKSLAARLVASGAGGGGGGGPGPGGGGTQQQQIQALALSDADKKNIEIVEEKLKDIDSQRAQMQGELAGRESRREVLDAAAKTRDAAFRAHNNNTQLMAWINNMAQDRAVSDYKLGRNEALSAVAEINKAKALLEKNDATINQNIQQEQASLEQTQQLIAQQSQAWTQQANATIAADKQSATDLLATQGEAASVKTTVSNFSSQMLSLITGISAAGGGPNPTLAGYAQILNNINSGAYANSSQLTGFTLQQFQGYETQIQGYQSQLTSGLAQLNSQTAPPPENYAESLVYEIIKTPGEPAIPPNPTAQFALQQLLPFRQKYWTGQLAVYQSDLNTINAMTNPSNQTQLTDVFGNKYYQSLPLREQYEQSLLTPAQAEITSDASTMDGLVKALPASFGLSGLPQLSGMTLDQLAQTGFLTNYANTLVNAKLPSGTDPVTVTAKMSIIQLAYLISDLSNQVLIGYPAEQTIEQINTATGAGGTLQLAQQGLTSVINMVNSVQSNINAQIALVQEAQSQGGNLTAAQNNAFIATETQFLTGLQAPLQSAAAMLNPSNPNSLIGYQNQAIADYSAGGVYSQLYTAKQSLLTSLLNAYYVTVPWSIETFGGSPSSAGGSTADVQAWIQQLSQYLVGYNDSSGNPQEGLLVYQLHELKDRMTPNFNTVDNNGGKPLAINGVTGLPFSFGPTENIYGETQPYSLPDKITKYSAEMTTRAQQINTDDGQINQILEQISAIAAKIGAPSEYDLSSSANLPTNVTTSNTSEVQALVNNNTLTNLGALLTKVGNDAKAKAKTPSIGLGGGQTVPVGPQPSPTVSAYNKIALLAQQAGVRLVASTFPTQSQPDNGNTAIGVARYLYDNAVIQAAQTGENFITNTANGALPFVNNGVNQINAALADAQNRLNFITSNAGLYNQSYAALSAAQQSTLASLATGAKGVYPNEVAIFTNLNNFLGQAVTFFNQTKENYDQGALATINSVMTYYQSLMTIDQDAITVDQSELTANQEMTKVLTKTETQVKAKLSELNDYLGQLNDPHDSAGRRTADSFGDMMDSFHQMIAKNFDFQKLSNEMKQSDAVMKADAADLQAKQEQLKAMLNDRNHPEILESVRKDPKLAQRINDLFLSRGMWEEDGNGASAMVVSKSQYPALVQALLGVVHAQNPSEDLGSLEQNLLQNPQNISNLHLLGGDAQVVDLGGGDADGFYLVYDTDLSVPNGLATGTDVKMGNIFTVLKNQISAGAYEFESPPEPNTSGNPGNAAYGDKGLFIQGQYVGANGGNEWGVAVHRDGLDIPASLSPSDQLNEDRLLVWDDGAAVLLNNHVYLGVGGYGDMAIEDSGQQPYYYGGNVKTSIELFDTGVSLTGDQENLFIKDPRSFLETFNLNFTGDNQALNKTFDVAASGSNGDVSRTQTGVTFDIPLIAKNLERGGSSDDSKTDDSKDGKDKKKDKSKSDPFTLEIFYDKIGGTEDLNQQAAAATLLKGFTLHRDSSGKADLSLTNTATAELGTQYNIFSDELAVVFPHDIKLQASGQIMGNESTYFAGVSDKVGKNTEVSAGYGSQFVGMTNRFDISVKTDQSWEDIKNEVLKDNQEQFQGGVALQKFNKASDAYFKENKSDENAAELFRVYKQYEAQLLIKSQAMGQLSKEVTDQQKAGSLLHNMHTQVLAGFVSGATSNDTSALALGAGPAAGTETQLTLTKTPHALIESEIKNICKEGLGFRDVLIDGTKEFMEAIKAAAAAEEKIQNDSSLLQSAPPQSSARAELQAKFTRDNADLHQALVKFNFLTGRQPNDEYLLKTLSGADLDKLNDKMRREITAPEGLADMMHSLDPAQLKAALGQDPFNIIDYIPGIEKVTLEVGSQISTIMDSQILGFSGSVRIPFYDSQTKHANKSYKLESQAVLSEMANMFQAHTRSVENEMLQGRLAQEQIGVLTPGVAQAQTALEQALAAYRNGVIGPMELEKSYDTWQWYNDSLIDAKTAQILAQAESSFESNFLPKLHKGPKVDISGLDSALGLVFREDSQKVPYNNTLRAIVERHRAVQETQEAAAHRYHEFYVDAQAGANLTDSGIALIPLIGITGISMLPVPGLEYSSKELQNHTLAQTKDKSEYYAHLEEKTKSNMALDIYNNVLAYQNAEKELAQLDNAVIPELQQGLEKAQAAGGLESDKIEAERKLDRARNQRQVLIVNGARALADINLLLGRSPDSPLDAHMDSDAALKFLRQYFQAHDPVKAEQKILDNQLDIAAKNAAIVDKNESVQQLTASVSFVASRLGRLVNALSGNGLGNRDKKKEALLQLLQAQRNKESFGKELAVDRGKVQAQWDDARSQLDEIKEEMAKHPEKRDDPQLNLEIIDLQERQLLLEGRRMALGMGDLDAVAKPDAYQEVPRSFDKLKNRLEEKERAIQDGPAKAGEANITKPDVEPEDHSVFAQYDHSIQTIDEKPKGDDYVDTWVEERLKSQGTSQADLLKLEKLFEAKKDQEYQTRLTAAANKADILMEDFAARVQMERFITAREKDHDSVAVAKVKQRIDGELKSERAEIAALLGINPSQAESLDDLVQEKSPSDPLALAHDFINQIDKDKNGVNRVQPMLFEGGIPAGLSDPWDQMRADILARNISVQGITPMAVFGIFSGHAVGGAFVQAPDMDATADGLESIIPQAEVKVLKGTKAFQNLTLHFNSSMSALQDDTHELESQAKAVKAAKADYAALMGRGDDPDTLAQADAARERVVKAWLTFNDLMAKSKVDLASLVTDIKALDQDHALAEYIAPISASDEDLQTIDPVPKQELRYYWSERMKDGSFKSAVEKHLDELSSVAPAGLQAQLEKDAAAWIEADARAQSIRDGNSADAEKDKLLTDNDAERYRQALENDLDALLKIPASAAFKDGDAQAGKTWSGFMNFMMQDLAAQAKDKAAQRADYNASARALRDAYWNAAGAPDSIKGAYGRLETIHRQMEDDWQTLMDDYLSHPDQDPAAFLQTDAALDAYLKDQQSFNWELIKTLESKEVQGDQNLLWKLEGLYDVRAALDEETGAGKYGRGIRALDALIELGQMRLSVAREENQSVQQINAIAASLEKLNAMKTRWQDPNNESDDLQPLYALVKRVGSDTGSDPVSDPKVDSWITAEQFNDWKEHGKLAQKDGRWYEADNQSVEVVAGIDADEAARDGHVKDFKDIDWVKDWGQTQFDFVPDRIEPDKPRGYSVDQVFNPMVPPPDAKPAAQFFFFAAPDQDQKDEQLHQALPEAKAIEEKPDQYLVYAYEGGHPMAYDRFPTLESLKASDNFKDFRQLKLSEPGVKDLSQWISQRQTSQSRAGWVDVKLHSYGFAVAPGGAQAKIILQDAQKYLAQCQKDEERLREKLDKEQEGKPAQDPASGNYQAAQERLKEAAGRLKVAEDRVKYAQEIVALDGHMPIALSLNQEAFDKTLRSLRDAPKDLQSAQKTLEEQRKNEEQKREELEKAQRENSKAQAGIKVDKKTQAKIEKQARLAVPPMPNEPDDQYQKRIQPEIDKRLEVEKGKLIVKNADAARAAKAYTEAKNNFRAAQGLVKGAQDGVTRAEDALQHSHEWSLYLTDELGLTLGKDKTVIGIEDAPVYGNEALKETFGAGRAASDIHGELASAVVDEHGRILDACQDAECVERDAKHWVMRSVAINGDDANIVNPDDISQIKTNYRLDHYEDKNFPVDPKDPSKGFLPVQLSRRYFESSVSSAKSGLFHRAYWGVMPENWLNLVLQVPKDIVEAPYEAVTGRNPDEQHYIGHVYAYGGEGGADERYGIGRKIGNTVDIFDLGPDPVEIYNDPSQFPKYVNVGSPILPGQNLASKDLDAKDKEYYLGAQAVQQILNYSQQDLDNINAETLSHFQGGVEKTFISKMRGRNGAYEESKRTAGTGSKAIEKALKDPLINADPRAVSVGAVADASPNNIEVDAVEERVKIKLGVVQYARAQAALAGYSGVVAGKIKEAQAERNEMESKLKPDEANLSSVIAAREQGRHSTQLVWEKYGKLDARIAQQKALEQRMSELRQESQDLHARLKWWQDYLKKLQKTSIDFYDRTTPLPIAPAAPLLLVLLGAALLAWEFILRRFWK